MSQAELFYENYLEALRDDVKAIGGAKEVGQKFWPEKHIEAARNMVNDRLNADRRDRFNDDQVHFIMRRSREVRGFSAALFHVCDETGFERPLAKNPVDEIAKRQQQFIEAVRDVQNIAKALEQLTKVPLTSVR